MKKSKLNIKDQPNRQARIFIGVVINVLVISSIIYLTVGSVDENVDVYTTAASISREEQDPGNYTDLTYPTPESALEEANDQLDSMNVGNISTIDDSDENYSCRLMKDYSMGGILYWELSSLQVDVILEAYTGEILMYTNYRPWIDGSKTQTEIEQLASSIASQFATIPPDCQGPSTMKYATETYKDYYSEDGEDVEIITTEYDQWTLEYNRVKNDIIAEDNIEIWMELNGDLNYYFKNWNLDLGTMSTSYSISKAQAENIATTYIGQYSIAIESHKRIVRPNYFWTSENPVYGENPTCVWEVYVKDVDDYLCICHVDGITGSIIGGDFIQDYYG